MPKISEATRQVWQKRLEGLCGRPLLNDEANEVQRLAAQLNIKLEWKLLWLNDSDGWIDNPGRKLKDAGGINGHTR